jgi:transcriptional regulator NrdR family protein
MDCCGKPMGIINSRYSDKTRVLNGINAKYRRRVCDICDNRLTTFEIDESDIEKIRKQAINDFKVELSNLLAPEGK